MAMGLICAQSDWVHAKSKGDFVGIVAFDLSAVIAKHGLVDCGAIQESSGLKPPGPSSRRPST